MVGGQQSSVFGRQPAVFGPDTLRYRDLRFAPIGSLRSTVDFFKASFSRPIEVLPGVVAGVEVLAGLDERLKGAAWRDDPFRVLDG